MTFYCKFVCFVRYGSVRNLIENKSGMGSIPYGSYVNSQYGSVQNYMEPILL